MSNPQPQILTIWRITLTAAAIIPAVLLSLFLRVGSTAWIWSSGGFGLLFLFLYLVYLPMLYKNTSFGVSGGKLIRRTGVFYTRVTAMPISRIQFVAVLRPAIGRLFGLASVIAVAPGGHITIRGLADGDAERLAALLGPSGEKGGPQ